MIHLQSLILEAIHTSSYLSDLIAEDPYHAASSPFLTPQQIDHLVTHPDRFVRKQIAAHPYLSSENLHTLLADPHPSVREAVAIHPRLSNEQLHVAANDPDWRVRSEVAGHPRLDADMLHTLINDPDEDARAKAIRHPNVDPAHLEDLYHKSVGNAEMIVSNIITHPKVPHSVLKHAVKESRSYRLEILRAHQHLPEDVVSDVFDLARRRTGHFSDDSEMAVLLAKQSNIKPEHLATLFHEHPNHEVREQVAKNPRLPDEIVDDILWNGNVEVSRNLAGSGRKFSPEHAERLVGHRLDTVRYAYASNPYLSKEHHKRLLNDPNTAVQTKASLNEHVEK